MAQIRYLVQFYDDSTISQKDFCYIDATALCLVLNNATKNNNIDKIIVSVTIYMWY